MPHEVLMERRTVCSAVRGRTPTSVGRMRAPTIHLAFMQAWYHVWNTAHPVLGSVSATYRPVRPYRRNSRMNAAYDFPADPDIADFAAARATLMERFEAVAAHLNHAAPRAAWVDMSDPDALTLRVGQHAYFTFRRTPTRPRLCMVVSDQPPPRGRPYHRWRSRTCGAYRTVGVLAPCEKRTWLTGKGNEPQRHEATKKIRDPHFLCGFVSLWFGCLLFGGFNREDHGTTTDGRPRGAGRDRAYRCRVAPRGVDTCLQRWPRLAGGAVRGGRVAR